jgi:uncharacterized protein (DUF2062 family)
MKEKSHMIKSIYNKVRTFIQNERCPRRLAFSVSLAVFIAFSPFVGFHTAMVFLFAWLFTLNAAVLLALSMLINNPWTMVPIYAADHVVGDQLFQLFGINGMELNPDWVCSLNKWIFHYTGLTGISFWAFLVGGNLLSIVLAIIIYPIIRYVSMQRIQF